MTDNRDIEFMDDLNAIQHAQPKKASIVFLYTTSAFVAALLAWSMCARVDEITHSRGTVVPSTNSQIVQSLEGGILQELLVKEGDIVKKGQPLMRLSDVAFSSEEKGTEGKYLALQARKSRQQAEANNTAFNLPAEIKEKIPSISANEEKLYQSRQEEYRNSLQMIDSKIQSSVAQIKDLKSQIASGNESAALLRKELGITSKMVQMKAVPEIEEIRIRRELNEEEGRVRSAQERIVGLQSDLVAAEKEKKDQADRFRSQALGELNVTEMELATLSENLKSLGDRVDRTEIKSPVEGIVNNIALKTIGGVVEPAMRLAEIVPVHEDLKITAKVPPKDIAFLRVGQPARITITAYDSTRYGYLEGKLNRIGANTIAEPDGLVNFEIEVLTDKNFLGTEQNPLPITSGMIAEVRVITGKKTILEYFLRPFLRLQDRIFSER